MARRIPARRPGGDDVLLVRLRAPYEVSVRDRLRQAGFDYLHVKGHDPFELVRWVEARSNRRAG